jgi:hypothetical protein
MLRVSVLAKHQGDVETFCDLDDNFVPLRQARESIESDTWIDAQLTVDMV